jgi:hypothetical protein
MLNTSFVVPCGPGGNQGYASINVPNGSYRYGASSSQTVTAVATDASGATIPAATLTMTVVSSGGL